MIIAAFDYAWYVGAVAVTGIVLAAIYVLWMYQRTMTGPTPERATADEDLSLREGIAVAPLVVALVFLGFYPAPLLDAADPYVGDLMSHVGVTDDPPEVTAPAADHAGDEHAEEGEH